MGRKCKIQKWIMKYIKQSLLFKLGILNVLWITYSYIEEIFHEPFRGYSFWNYFVLIENGKMHTDVIDTSIHDLAVSGIIIMILFTLIVVCAIFTSKSKIQWTDLFLFAFMIIFIIECIVLVNVQNKICDYVSVILEILMVASAGTEMSINILS